MSVYVYNISTYMYVMPIKKTVTMCSKGKEKKYLKD